MEILLLLKFYNDKIQFEMDDESLENYLCAWINGHMKTSNFLN